MATLDWVFAAVLVLSLAVGAWRGLVFEVLSVAGWVGSFVLAQWWAPAVAQWLPMGQWSPALRYAAGFVVVLVGSLFAVALLAMLARKVIEAVGLRPVDRILGAAFGLLRGFVIVLAVTVVAQMTPVKDTQTWNESAGAQASAQVLKGLKPILPERFGQYLPG
ncbi:MAG: CvpA family protein [Ramlibacter sp.]|jgi:membrane protein required for colicin V production